MLLQWALYQHTTMYVINKRSSPTIKGWVFKNLPCQFISKEIVISVSEEGLHCQTISQDQQLPSSRMQVMPSLHHPAAQKISLHHVGIPWWVSQRGRFLPCQPPPPAVLCPQLLGPQISPLPQPILHTTQNFQKFGMYTCTCPLLGFMWEQQQKI